LDRPRRTPIHRDDCHYNTADLPTTGGSVLLEGSIPPADAFVVKKLRDAGAIILAKINMSEF
jgi:amidase